MPIKSVLKMGNEKLATPSLPVINFLDGELKELLTDLQDTMREKGGIGLAAPQIGCNLRVVIFGFQHSARYPNEKPVPFTILVNPKIEILSEETIDGWEGCLSLPGLRGYVTRYKKIRYSGCDENGDEFSREVEGFPAKMVQHECDHLDGILIPQRIKDMKLFGFEEELKHIIWPNAK